MKKLILILLLAMPVAAQNYTGYNGTPVARTSFLRSSAAVKGNIFGDSSLVGWWPMTAATGAIAPDLSGIGNDGVWSGTKAGTNGYWKAGKTGPWAGYFNGTDDKVVASAATPSLPYTIAFWINPDVLPTWANMVVVNSTTSNGLFYIQYNGSAVDAGWYNGSSWVNAVGPALPLNKWSFVVAVYTTGNVAIYVYNASGRNSSSGALSGTPLLTGTWKMTAGGSSFSGTVQGIRVYKRALTAAEITAIYTAGSK